MSDYETSQKRQNIVVGFFVLIGLGALVWLIAKFGDLPIIVSDIRSFAVIVQFPTAKGIEKNAPVEFCGYRVGKVTQVMSPERLKDNITGLVYHQTKVILNIDNKYADIPANVDVKLMTRSLGSSYIELIFNPQTETAPPEPNQPFLADGMVLQGSTGMTSEFFPAESQQKLIELIDGVNRLVANANDIIGSQANKDNFKVALANFAEASGRLQKTLDDLHQLAQAGTTTLQHADSKIDQLTETINTAGVDFKNLSSAGVKTLDTVNTTANKMTASTDKLVTATIETTVQLNQTLTELHLILAKVNTGEGTASRILNDGAVYENLLNNTEQLEAVLKEMKTVIGKWQNQKIKVSLF
jgi:phospholipid/cholesterol/gamma-HCH transport system substrate-binding protein